MQQKFNSVKNGKGENMFLYNQENDAVLSVDSKTLKWLRVFPAEYGFEVHAKLDDDDIYNLGTFSDPDQAKTVMDDIAENIVDDLPYYFVPQDGMVQQDDRNDE